MKLEGTTTLVAGGPGQLGVQLAEGLRRLGATVGLLGSLATREQALEAFEGAVDRLGPIDSVVHVAGVESGLDDRLLVETDEDAWERGAEAPIRSALVVLQGAHPTLRERGGSIVVVLPSVALTGAAGLVPFASASEGIRLLAKSAARSWGQERVRVNCVTLPVEEWELEPPERHAVPNRFGAALGPMDVAVDAAGAVALLVSTLSSGVTGATIGVDRGTVMAP